MTKIILSALVMAFLIFVIFFIKQGNYGLMPFFCWIFAVLTTLLIFSPTKAVHFKISVFILVIIALYLIRGLLFVNYSNLFFHGDEAIISRNAQNNFLNIINNGKWNLLGSENSTINKLPSLWYFIQGLFIYIFGVNIASIKLFSLITDLVICCLGYLLVKDLVNKRVAISFVLIYSTLPISIHFSLTGYQNIQSTLFLVASLYALFRSRSFWSGILCALSFYFYQSSVVVPFILLFSIAINGVSKHDKFKTTIKTFLAFLVGFMEGITPYIAYTYFHYSFILGRKEAILFFNNTNNIPKLLLEQTKTYLSGFLPGGSMSGSGVFYGFLPGFNTWILLVTFLIGIVYVLLRRNILGIISIVIIAITSIFGGILTNLPPAPQRLIHIFPFMVIMACFGVEFITIAIKKLLPILNSKLTFYLIVSIVVFTNVLSFFRSNLPMYRRLSNTDIAETVDLITQTKSPLLFNGPIQKTDQIYFFSGGVISPIIITSCDQLSRYSQTSSYALVDKKGFTAVSSCPALNSSSLVKSWTTFFDHMYLYKLILQ